MQTHEELMLRHPLGELEEQRSGRLGRPGHAQVASQRQRTVASEWVTLDTRALNA